jgi:hypothetical protein
MESAGDFFRMCAFDFDNYVHIYLSYIR